MIQMGPIFCKKIGKFYWHFLQILHENNTRGKNVSKMQERLFNHLPTSAIKITNTDVLQGPKYVST